MPTENIISTGNIIVQTINESSITIITTALAWWGALIATLVLLWDIYKWKSAGPKIKVCVSANMQTFGNIKAIDDDKTYIVVNVTNIGNKKTTITHLIGYNYHSVFHKLIKKSNKIFTGFPKFAPPLPFLLEPGACWSGGIEQVEELEKLSKNGSLYIGIFHSLENKPVLEKVIIK